jgi:glyoxylase-like metal-dependent hydrolase (beta-lactamase superfamily II)
MRDSTVPLALVNEGLGNTSYLVDLGDGRALVVDPERDPGRYLAAAEARGLTIGYTAETHLHADFVSGSRELAAHGAQVLAPAAGGIEFGHRGLHDGDELGLGGLALRALATPGHTPEHLAYLLEDGSRPAALFSGGSLLVGAVARTDLIAPDRTEELARSLWRSLHERILPLPDDLPVYPTHGAGSFCAAPAGAERTTTIGAERAANPLLAAPSEDAFVQLLLDGLGSYPPYFLRLREINRKGRQYIGLGPQSLPPSPPRTSAGSSAQAPSWWMPARSPPSPLATSPRRYRSRCARPSPPGLAGSPARTSRPPSSSSPARTGPTWSARLAASATSSWPANWPAACPHGKPPPCRCAGSASPRPPR